MIIISSSFAPCLHGPLGMELSISFPLPQSRTKVSSNSDTSPRQTLLISGNCCSAMSTLCLISKIAWWKQPILFCSIVNCIAMYCVNDDFAPYFCQKRKFDIMVWVVRTNVFPQDLQKNPCFCHLYP